VFSEQPCRRSKSLKQLSIAREEDFLSSSLDAPDTGRCWIGPIDAGCSSPLVIKQARRCLRPVLTWFDPCWNSAGCRRPIEFPCSPRSTHIAPHLDGAGFFPRLFFFFASIRSAVLAADLRCAPYPIFQRDCHKPLKT